MTLTDKEMDYKKAKAWFLETYKTHEGLDKWYYARVGLDRRDLTQTEYRPTLRTYYVYRQNIVRLTLSVKKTWAPVQDLWKCMY